MKFKRDRAGAGSVFFEPPESLSVSPYSSGEGGVGLWDRSASMPDKTARGTTSGARRLEGIGKHWTVGACRVEDVPEFVPFGTGPRTGYGVAEPQSLPLSRFAIVAAER